jgi:hypothetical protein
MKRNISLLSFLAFLPLLLLTGAPAYGGIITLTDLLSTGTCTAPPDPNTPGAEFGSPSGCWTLQNLNSDGSSTGEGTGDLLSGLTVTGSNTDPDGVAQTPIGTVTQFTTVITDKTPGLELQPDGITVSGDLAVNWNYITVDAGSFYDPAGYFLCSASPTGFPSGSCGLYQLTSDYNAFYDVNALPGPYMESGSFTVFNLAPGDVFGAYVQTLDNTFGAGMINFSDPVMLVPTPEPASFLLIGAGLLALGRATRKAQRAKKTAV